MAMHGSDVGEADLNGVAYSPSGRDSSSIITSFNEKDEPRERHSVSALSHSFSTASTDRALPPDATRSESTAPLCEGNTRIWRRTLIRSAPLSGIAAMGLAALSIVASLGVLAGSDGAAVDDWHSTPSTYLAIFTAIGNLSMRYAAIQGVIIAWTSIRGALSSGRQMGWLGLACIFSTLVVIDGPLLQRSSTVVQASFEDHPVTLNFSMAPEIPFGYTGSWSALGSQYNWSLPFNSTIPTPKGGTSNHIETVDPGVFAARMASWQQNKPYLNVVRGCPGECTAKLVAPALAQTTCVSHTIDTSYTTPRPPKDFPGRYSAAAPLDTQAFLISVELMIGEPREKISLVTGHATSDHCLGTLNYTTCTLESAIGEYTVSIKNNELSLDNPADPTILSLATNAVVDNTTVVNGEHTSTLGGVADLMYGDWETSLVFMNVSGTIAGWVDNQPVADLFVGSGKDALCPNFTDPREQFMASVNKLMVFFGQSAAQGIQNPNLTSLNPAFPIHTTATGYLKGSRNVYQTNYHIFLAAALVELVCICLVAPTYWGWWKIGRPVSFSPLEMAKAFEAPILAPINSNSAGHDIAAAAGDVQVRYGASCTGDHDGRTRLAFADSEVVDYPKQRSMFDV